MTAREGAMAAGCVARAGCLTGWGWGGDGRMILPYAVIWFDSPFDTKRAV